MSDFLLHIGKKNNILPGDTMTKYNVTLKKDLMICQNQNNSNIIVEISFSSFREAEFKIENANLWLKCQLKSDSFIFCAPRKHWMGDIGKELVEKIEKVVKIKGFDYYKKYTGDLFISCLFS